MASSTREIEARSAADHLDIPKINTINTDVLIIILQDVIESRRDRRRSRGPSEVDIQRTQSGRDTCTRLQNLEGYRIFYSFLLGRYQAFDEPPS